MTLSINQIREKRQAKAIEYRNIVEANTGDGWTEEHAAQCTVLQKDIDSLDQQIEHLQASYEATVAERERIDKRADAAGTGLGAAADTLEQERAIFNTWLRRGEGGLSAEQQEFVRERKAEGAGIYGQQGLTPDTAGGYLVPRDFSGVILSALKAFGGIRLVASNIQTSGGNPIDWPTNDETNVMGELVAEHQTATDGDMTFGTVALGAFKYSSKVVTVSFELLQDERVDLEPFIINALSLRIARITNSHFTVGTGSGQPNGVVTASALGETGAVGGTPTITYDNLVNLEHSVDPAYRISPSVRFMMHDSVLKMAKLLKDSQGRPLWMPSVAGSAPATILGYEYVLNQSMAAAAVSSKSLLFGDFADYMIRDVMNVTLFRFTDSVYIKKGQIGFLSWSRHDGQRIAADDQSIKHFAFGAAA